MSKERFEYYYNERVKRYEVFDCYVNLPLSKKGVIETLNDQQDKIADLEAKLAESEEKINMLEEHKFYADNIIQAYADKWKNHNQDKISFAVEQLVWLKEKVNNAKIHKINMINIHELYEILSNQINQLKGGN